MVYFLAARGELHLGAAVDYMDLGPEAGDRGGQVVFAGTPEDLARDKNSRTAKYIL